MVDSDNAFDVLAERYDSWYESGAGKAIYENELECVAGMVPEDGPLLEIGVGTGRFAMRFPSSFGVDPALGALRLAVERGIRPVAGRGEELPFREGSFGCILIIATLCFVDDPLKTLKEAKRVLKDGGCLVIGFIPGDSEWGVLYEKKKQEGHTFYKNARFFTYGEMKGLIQAAGLEVSRVRSTLLEGPGKDQRGPGVVEGNPDGPGFVCVLAGKRKRPGKAGQDPLKTS